MTRPCQACDGTGWLVEPNPSTTRERGMSYTPCIACDSIGRIADTGYMPASDAQADAETLRLFVVLVRGHVNVARALFAAQEYGGYARNAARHNPDVPTVKIEARGAAQAAFRAVPGLRD